MTAFTWVGPSHTVSGDYTTATTADSPQTIYNSWTGGAKNTISMNSTDDGVGWIQNCIPVAFAPGWARSVMVASEGSIGLFTTNPSDTSSSYRASLNPWHSRFYVTNDCAEFLFNLAYNQDTGIFNHGWNADANYFYIYAQYGYYSGSGNATYVAMRVGQGQITIAISGTSGVTFGVFTSGPASTSPVNSYSIGTFSGTTTVYTFSTNTKPTATITAPAAASTHDPRDPLTVTWSYSDAENDPQAQWEVGWKQATGSIYTVIGSGPNANTSFTIPANTLDDATDVDISVRVYDGKLWSTTATRRITSDSWTYLSEVVSSSNSGALPQFAAGNYEAAVRTGDSGGLGAWSDPVAFEVDPTSSAKIYDTGSWKTVPLFVYVNGAWVARRKQRL